jgi:two-component system sensor histidine kinase QseC
MVESERRFTADAAHELRTPIAAIRAQAQVAQTVVDDVLRRRALTRTLEGCDRAAHLIDQLLVLSKLDADGDARPARTSVDLSDVVRSVAADLAPQAFRQGQTLELDAPAACRSVGDATLLAVLARNLIDNALRYSPEGARVDVAVRSDRGRVMLSVEDGGPGLAEADRQRLGERFFRVAGSAASGSGLGWSIVRRIADVHGAELRVERSDSLGGLAVRVRFPAESAAPPAFGVARPAQV